MARSTHASYTAADRYERRATRRQKRPNVRRQTLLSLITVSLDSEV